jgi:hypothetical protein
VQPPEAEAAVALLLDYTGTACGVRYHGIDLSPEAEAQDLLRDTDFGEVPGGLPHEWWARG